MFLYSGVSTPLDRSRRFILHIWKTCSFRHQVNFSGKHSSHAAITREDQITHISTTARSELGHRGESENAQTSKYYRENTIRKAGSGIPRKNPVLCSVELPSFESTPTVYDLRTFGERRMQLTLHLT